MEEHYFRIRTVVMNFIVCGVFLSCYLTLVYARTFEVDYELNCFLKDGEPFRYVSGEIHYFRVPAPLWADRINKMKMAGLNAIQTYIEWSRHEPENGLFDFDTDNDIGKFFETAQEAGMLVILRPGPYIDAERDMGGFPYWLTTAVPRKALRTMNKSYLEYVENWLTVLFDVIRPYLYSNGGPIIMLQVENEYGSTGCEVGYMNYLADLFRSLLNGADVVLFTTDGISEKNLRCGKATGVLSTIDFGARANVTQQFETLRSVQPNGPLVNSEFYAGFLDSWGYPHSVVNASDVVDTLYDILQADASVSVYMFHGGTSFGFGSGSILRNNLSICTTSYDYDAPLTEAGDPTEKYFALREVIGQFLPLPQGPLPGVAPKMKLSPIRLKKVMSIWDFISHSDTYQRSLYPLSFEQLGQAYGFVLYQVTVEFSPKEKAQLKVPNLADRAHVFINREIQTILSREQMVFSAKISVSKGDTIQFLVENQGRVCVNYVDDPKGIFENVTLDDQILTGWTMYSIKLDSDWIREVEKSNNQSDDNVPGPAFYTGGFLLPTTEIYDTYLRLDQWNKGVAFLNGINLGRYWPAAGPQVTLYAPSFYFDLQEDRVNQVTLFEVDSSPCQTPNDCYVQFVSVPEIDGPTARDD